LQGAASDYSPAGTERRYNIYPTSPGVQPRVHAGVQQGVHKGSTHVSHRNVAAFGEITVMPVGDSAGTTSDNQDNVRVAVDEELF